MAIQFVTTQIKDLAITNAKLAGSIANAKLTNSSITVAGTAISLGGSIAAAALAGNLALDDIGLPDAAVSLNSKKITNLADPTAAQDAATKAYVDATSQGLDVKESCRVASTGNLTLSGTQTIDGIGVVADDRVLVKNQTSAVNNGIYVCAAGAWSRASDFAAGDNESGAFTFVEEGTVNADSGWVNTADKGSVVGTNNTDFAQFSGAGSITAGDGLSKSGNTLSVNVDDSSIQIDTDTLKVKALGVTNAMLAGSIANAKLANSTISGKALGTNLDGLSAGNGLTIPSPFNGSAAQSISVNLDGTTLAAGGSGIKVNTGGISNNEISGTAGISLTKLEAVASAKIIVGNASNVAAAVSLSGDATISNGGALTIAAGAIDNAKIDANAAIALTKLASVTSANIIVGNASNVAAAVAMSGDATISNAGAITVSAGAIDNGKISGSAAIALSKLEAVTSANIIVGNGSNQAASVALSGDATLANTGAVTIAANAVSLAKFGARPATDTYTGNGSTTTFDLSNRMPSSGVFAKAARVYLNGQRLKPVAASPADTSEYTVSDTGSATRITLGAAPGSGELIQVDSWY